MAHSLIHLALVAAVLAALGPALVLGQGTTQATCDVCAADGWYPPTGTAATDNCQTQYCVCYAPYTDTAATTPAVSNAWLYTCPSGAGTATCFNQTTKKCTACLPTCTPATGRR